MTSTETAPETGNGGFEPLRPYGPGTDQTAYIAELHGRISAANQRAAELAEQLEQVTAANERLEHQVADLTDRNRELASDLDDALDIADEHALDPERERLAVVPDRLRFVNAFAAAAERENGYDR